MKAWEIVGWASNGEAFCTSHEPVQGNLPDAPSPVFADQSDAKLRCSLCEAGLGWQPFTVDTEGLVSHCGQPAEWADHLQCDHGCFLTRCAVCGYEEPDCKDWPCAS